MIDPFMTDANTRVAPEPQTDLLRTPVLPQRHLDQYPGFAPYPWLGLALASIHSKSVGLGGSINPETPVSSALTADCGFVNIYNSGNLVRVMTCFHQGMNLVSLFLSKLRVAFHVYSSCLAVRDRLVMLLQLAFLASGGVALRS